MIRPPICIALVAAGLLFPVAPAQAAESYDNCTGFVDSLPATISTQGTWCLNRDLSTSVASGSAITIAAHNVTLDCNHFKIGGLAAGPGTNAQGVRAANRFNTTVRNCSIRGFHTAIYFTGGGGQLVEDNNFDGNTVYGMWVFSTGSTIRNNLVIDTGGSNASSGEAIGIYAANGVDILNNTVNGVAPTGANANPLGILATSNGDGSINGNRVRGLAPTGAGVPYGIYIGDSDGAVIRDNDVKGSGTGMAGSIGVGCSSSAATASGNVISRFETGIASCLSSANVVNTD